MVRQQKEIAPWCHPSPIGLACWCPGGIAVRDLFVCKKVSTFRLAGIRSAVASRGKPTVIVLDDDLSVSRALKMPSGEISVPRKPEVARPSCLPCRLHNPNRALHDTPRNALEKP